ncbi:MAG: amidohydrolase family protein [Planctomycetes bacterium]|nr:amidohydrolase family protein [Planctomycetota bacterium]
MIFDVNLSVGHWPFQALHAETPSRLATIMARAGIAAGLVSSIDAVLLPAPDDENEQLFSRLGKHEQLIPVPVVNPLLPQWPGAVRQYAARTPAVKIYPNYHGYALSDECVAELLRELGRRRLALLLPLRIEDERSHHPLMKVPVVPTDDILRLAGAFPDVAIVCCCPYSREAAALLKGPPNVYVDISMIDGLDPVRSLVEAASSRRVLFGSHAPFLYALPATLKVEESDIAVADRQRIQWKNARQILRLRRLMKP